MIDTEFVNGLSTAKVEQRQRISHCLQDEIKHLENLLADSIYGETLMYAAHLFYLYKINLEILAKLYQRPSSTYGEEFNATKVAIEKLIKTIQKPEWIGSPPSRKKDR